MLKAVNKNKEKKKKKERERKFEKYLQLWKHDNAVK